MKTLTPIFGVIFCAILLTMSACQDQECMEALARYQQAEDLEALNTDLTRKFYQHLDALQLDSLEALCVPDVHIQYQSGEPASFSDMVPFIQMFYAAFPDYTHRIEGMIAADDQVVVRVSFEGTFENAFMELPPNGEKFKYKGIQIFQFTDGKLKAMWIVEDELAMMTQLGLALGPA